MKKYKVQWWEEQIVRKTVEIEAVDEGEAQDKAMYGDVGDAKVEVEFVDATDSGHISTIIVNDAISHILSLHL